PSFMVMQRPLGSTTAFSIDSLIGGPPPPSPGHFVYTGYPMFMPYRSVVLQPPPPPPPLPAGHHPHPQSGRPAGRLLLQPGAGPDAGHGAHLHADGVAARRLLRLPAAPGGGPEVRLAGPARCLRQKPGPEAGRGGRQELSAGQRLGGSAGVPRHGAGADAHSSSSRERGPEGGRVRPQGRELLHGQRPGLQLRRQPRLPGPQGRRRRRRRGPGRRPAHARLRRLRRLRRRRRLRVRRRRERGRGREEPAAADGLHQRAAAGAGEGVPLQEVPVADRALAESRTR
ncbi:unnamed protein product, partial [Tetraodon nigroviridis]